MRHWSADYVGIPWRDKGRTRAGWDCWAAVLVPLRELRGIILPSYDADYVSTEERSEVAALFGKAAEWPWNAVALDDARELDIVIFRRAGVDSHIGLVTAPGTMLHVVEGGETCIESYLGRWKPRISGVYRHAGLMADA